MRAGSRGGTRRRLLVAGDVEVDDGRGWCRLRARREHGRRACGPGLRRPAGERLRRRRLPRRDARGYRRAGEALLETGVTAYLPTLITSPEEQLLAATARGADRQRPRPRILGVHLEGPVPLARAGSARTCRRRAATPTCALLDRLLDGGPVRLMTLAPELPGAGELIDRLLARGVAVSLGHTDATAAQAHDAFDRGARGVTHLFNAMRPFMHRDPGIVGAALARDDVVVSMILDGIHLAPETAQSCGARPASGSRSSPTRSRRPAWRRCVQLRQPRRAGARGRGSRARRRARGQRADDDRGGAEPARARRAARGRGRRRHLDARPRPGRARARLGSTSACRPTSSS